MKRIFSAVAIIMAMMVAVPQVNAQSQREIAKERKQVAKLSKKGLNAKASKAARKEAKRLKRQGWLVTPGLLPLEKQLDRSYMMQFEYDESLYPLYITDNAMSVGENYDAAKIQALELAKQNLAGKIQTEITALVENTVGNQQLAAEEAASIVQTVTASKNIISQRLGRIITVVECYRTLDNKNKEVLVHVAYNHKMAMEQAKQAIREELEAKGEKLHEQLDNILGF